MRDSSARAASPVILDESAALRVRWAGWEKVVRSVWRQSLVGKSACQSYGLGLAWRTPSTGTQSNHRNAPVRAALSQSANEASALKHDDSMGQML